MKCNESNQDNHREYCRPCNEWRTRKTTQQKFVLYKYCAVWCVANFLVPMPYFSANMIAKLAILSCQYNIYTSIKHQHSQLCLLYIPLILFIVHRKTYKNQLVLKINNTWSKFFLLNLVDRQFHLSWVFNFWGEDTPTDSIYIYIGKSIAV